MIKRQKNRNRSETWCRLEALIMSSTMSCQSKQLYFCIIDFGSSALETTLLDDRKDGSCDSDDQKNRRHEAVITSGALPCQIVLSAPEKMSNNTILGRWATWKDHGRQ